MRAQFRHFGDRGFEEIAAGCDLRRRRLVFRRHAAHGIGDPAIDQFKSVVGARRILAARKPVMPKRLVQQIAGLIAGERPAGAVGALQPRRETDDQQPRVERTEGGHRRVEPGRLFGAPFVAKRDQPRTARTVASGLALGRHALRGCYSKASSSSSAPTSAVALARCGTAGAGGTAACCRGSAPRSSRGARARAFGRVAADLSLQASRCR